VKEIIRKIQKCKNSQSLLVNIPRVFADSIKLSQKDYVPIDLLNMKDGSDVIVVKKLGAS
jgi:hypothetical protein